MKKGYSKHMAHGDKQVMRNPYHDEQKSFRLLISFLRQLESVESPVTPLPLQEDIELWSRQRKLPEGLKTSHTESVETCRQLSLWSCMINSLHFKQQKMFQQVRRVYKCRFVINRVWGPGPSRLTIWGYQKYMDCLRCRLSEKRWAKFNY